MRRAARGEEGAALGVAELDRRRLRRRGDAEAARHAGA
jgi:hypothetical protein